MTLALNSLGSFSEYPNFDEQTNNRLGAHVRVVGEIIRDAHSTRDRINADPGLNSTGKNSRIRKAFDKSRVEIDRSNDHHAKSFRETVEKAKSSIPRSVVRNELSIGDTNDPWHGDRIVRNSIERLRHHQAEQEIRQHLLTMDPTERVAAIQGAGADGDTHTILAAKNAPRIMHLVDPNVLAEAEQTCLRTNHPDKFEALSQAEAALEAFNANAEAAIRMLGGDNADPVRAAAQSTD